MKKIFERYLILIILILGIIINITSHNQEIIFCNYKRIEGFVSTEEVLIIQKNGNIEKIDRLDMEEKIQKAKLTQEDLNKIKDIMINIENTQLSLKEDTAVSEFIYAELEEYINVNRKINLIDNNTSYTNEYIEELNKCIEEIQQKYLK